MNNTYFYSCELLLLQRSEILNAYLEDIHTDFDSTERLQNSAYPANAAFNQLLPQQYYERNFYEGSFENISELTDDFYRNIFNSTEYTDCKCHSVSFETHHAEVMELVKSYAKNIFSFWDKEKFQYLLSENKISDFSSDYYQTYQSLSDKMITLKKADESLLYWKDAIPDELLYSALISLHNLAIMRHM